MFDLTLIQTPNNSHNIWFVAIPAISTLLAGLIPYWVNNKKIYNQILLERKIEDLINLKSSLVQYYYEVRSYQFSSKKDGDEAKYIMLNIDNKRLDFIKNTDNSLHYLSDELYEQIIDFKRKFIVVDKIVQANLTKKITLNIDILENDYNLLLKNLNQLIQNGNKRT